jgi:type IV secretory pathway VirB10-like protein
MDDQSLAVIGHNNPPEATPFDLSREEIEGIWTEAKNWLDGTPVKSQAEADEIAKLVKKATDAAKIADDRRVSENKPFDDGKAAVQAKYNPLIQKDRGKVDLIKAACRKALAPFLAEQQRQRDEEAAAERQKAAEARRKADEAMVAARASSNLAAREEAEALARQAKGAERSAKEAENTKVGASGGGRRITVRKIDHAKVTDMKVFAAHVWTTYRSEIDEWMLGFAEQLVTSGARNLPGVVIWQEEKAQ